MNRRDRKFWMGALAGIAFGIPAWMVLWAIARAIEAML